MCVSPHLLEKSRMGIFFALHSPKGRGTKTNHMYLLMLWITHPRQYNNHIPLNSSD